MPLASRGALWWLMPYAFLSDEWFTKVEELVAAAGDLQIPPAMKTVAVNVTVTGAATGPAEVRLAMKEGLFTRGHRSDFATTLTLSADLARKIFIDGDTAAGVQAFLDGELPFTGIAEVIKRALDQVDTRPVGHFSDLYKADGQAREAARSLIEGVVA